MSDIQQNTPEQPQVITLDKNTSINILIQYIEVAQKAGAYELKEAEILKRVVDFLINNAPDNELNELTAINVLIQGIVKAQKHGGAFTLNDAALLHKVITFIVQLFEQQQQPAQAPPAQTSSSDEDDDDLASLSEPVPLRPKEI